MADALKHWRVYCETEATHVETWMVAEPSQCPNDAGHTIAASKTAVVGTREVDPVVIEAPLEPVDAGVSKVIANGRIAIEVQNGVTGFAATHLLWPKLKQYADPKLFIVFRFIMKETGTGDKARLAVKAKAQGVGEDTSSAFTPEGFVAATINYTTIGEVFDAEVELDGSGFEKGDAVGLQIGRDGNNEMGAGDSDNASSPIQIIAMQVGVR